MESVDRIVMLDGLKKIFKILETVTETIKGIQKVNDSQMDINIFLVKRIERLEKREKIELH